MQKKEVSQLHKPHTVKRGNLDRRGNFDQSGSFVKDATVLNRERIFAASAFMEMND